MPDDNVLEIDETQTPAEQPPAAPPEEPEDEEEKPPEPAPEEQKVPLSRLNEVIAKRHQAEQDAAYWRGIAEGRQPKQEQKPAAVDQPPNQADFEKYDDYLDARADYRARKATEQMLHQVFQARDVQQANHDLGEMAALGVAEGSKKHPNLQQEIDSSDLANDAYANIVNTAIQTESFGDIAHYLAVNPAELNRISRMSPQMQVFEVGRLAARFESANGTPNQPKTRTVSNAPPPPQAQVGGGTSASKREEDMNTEEWIKWREKQVRKRQQAAINR